MILAWLSPFKLPMISFLSTFTMDLQTDPGGHFGTALWKPQIFDSTWVDKS